MKSLLILLLAAGGCVTRIETVEPDRPAAAPVAAPRKTVQDKRVVIDPDLKHIIQIVGIKSAMGPEGFLKIQVDVQNLTGSIEQFTYHIDWFDRDAVSLPMASSASIPWTLLSHETSFLAAASPTPAAKDFRVTFLGPGK